MTEFEPSQILKLLKALQAQYGMAMLFITHDLGVVAEIADEVAVMYLGRIVEQCDADTLFNSPKHPYTQALLRSIPLMGSTYQQPLHAIRGRVPSPLNWPAGCRFADRCDAAFDRCAEEPPEFMADGQGARCWLCESVAARSEAAT